MVETKRGKILLGIGLILPMLIMFYFLDFYSFMWKFMGDFFEAYQLIPNKEDIVPMLQAFVIIAVFAIGVGGSLILYDTLWGKGNTKK